MDGDTFREGIFSLYTRRLGTVAEMMIERMVKLGKRKNQFHDLYDDKENKRVEVKFSCVPRKWKNRISKENVLDCVAAATSEQRLVQFANWKGRQFDSNIQQVKRTEFDVLYYGLFFADVVLIFRIESKDIDSKIYYSDKQHMGNKGEGQFHINEKILQFHLDNYFYKTLTYDELLELLTD